MQTKPSPNQSLPGCKWKAHSIATWQSHSTSTRASRKLEKKSPPTELLLPTRRSVIANDLEARRRVKANKWWKTFLIYQPGSGFCGFPSYPIPPLVALWGRCISVANANRQNSGIGVVNFGRNESERWWCCFVGFTVKFRFEWGWLLRCSFLGVNWGELPVDWFGRKCRWFFFHWQNSKGGISRQKTYSWMN